MAGFCSRCGAPLSSDTGFCPSCGAQLDGAPANPGGVAPVPAPAYGQPIVPPPPGYPIYPAKSSGGALKIVLIVIAVVVGLGIAAAGIIGFIGWRAMHAHGNSFSLGSNAGVADADLGVPIYPGATRIEKGGMRLKAANNLMVSSAYTTSDPPSAVLDFYRGKMGGQAIENKNVRGTSFESVSVNGNEKDSVIVTVNSDSQLNNGLTHIVILHTKTTTP